MRIRSIALVVATLAMGACGGDKATGPGGTLAGNYTLRTVNGGGLPVVIAQLGSDKLEVTSGSVTMNENNTFTGVTAFRETIDGDVDTFTATCPGTYTRSGSSITFTEADS